MSLDAEFTTKKPEKPKQKEKQTNKQNKNKQTNAVFFWSENTIFIDLENSHT